MSRNAKPKPKPPAKPISTPATAPQPPLPLTRSTLTVFPHWDRDFGWPMPVTVEVIILAQGEQLDEQAATRADVPDLNQAGWSAVSHGLLTVYSRVIG